MPLIIETGSGVEGANSYVTVDEIREYAEQRGLTLPVEDAEVEIQAVKGFDYVESFRSRFQGIKSSPIQTCQWPRFGVEVEGYLLPEDEIPYQLKQAQCQAAVEAGTADLLPNPTQAVKRRKVDVIEVEYQDGETTTGFTKVDTLLQPLLRKGGKIRVVRG